MTPLREVPVATLPLERFAGVLLKRPWRELQEAIERAGVLLHGRAIWSVNSTAVGGGVAEMLRSLLGYARDARVDARWVVVQGDADFFAITKRLHNNLHGSPGDGGALGARERAVYERTLAAEGEQLAMRVRPGDVVLLHDPQTAGLVPALGGTGAHVVWRSHIGHDVPEEHGRRAMAFLLPYVREAQACVFSRPAHAWEGLDPRRLTFIAPSIDAFSVKNQPMRPVEVHAILRAAGIIDGAFSGAPVFERSDGTPGRVDRRAEVLEESRLAVHTPLVTQVSRWDRLKDPVGVLRGFVEHAAPATDAHLVLAGPATDAVADDPEGAAALAEVRAAWHALGPADRARVHLVSLPMDDAEENAAVVNALQRGSRVVCQKSIAEGFGLTVAEAMWKGRPVVAARVGGIQDQIEDGVTGLLVDTADLEAFGAAIRRLLADRDAAERMGVEARRRVRDAFLGPRHLIQYLDLFHRLIAAEDEHGGDVSAPAVAVRPS